MWASLIMLLRCLPFVRSWLMSRGEVNRHSTRKRCANQIGSHLKFHEIKRIIFQHTLRYANFRLRMQHVNSNIFIKYAKYLMNVYTLLHSPPEDTFGFQTTTMYPSIQETQLVRYDQPIQIVAIAIFLSQLWLTNYTKLLV